MDFIYDKLLHDKITKEYISMRGYYFNFCGEDIKKFEEKFSGNLLKEYVLKYLDTSFRDVFIVSSIASLEYIISKSKLTCDNSLSGFVSDFNLENYSELLKLGYAPLSCKQLNYVINTFSVVVIKDCSILTFAHWNIYDKFIYFNDGSFIEK